MSINVGLFYLVNNLFHNYKLHMYNLSHLSPMFCIFTMIVTDSIKRYFIHNMCACLKSTSHTKFHLSTANDSLYITTKTRGKESICIVAALIRFSFEFWSHNTYTGCPRRNVPDFGRVFLMLKYTDIIQNTYVQS